MMHFLAIPVSVGPALTSVSVSITKLANLLVISATCLASDDEAKPTGNDNLNQVFRFCKKINKFFLHFIQILSYLLILTKLMYNIDEIYKAL